ncbi:MAG: hypothetical protein HS113_27255 [Verrucomicrobiales bacterium]|nr:hypothetical protein [Verrucomicrobiales bacterium]
MAVQSRRSTLSPTVARLLWRRARADKPASLCVLLFLVVALWDALSGRASESVFESLRQAAADRTAPAAKELPDQREVQFVLVAADGFLAPADTIESQDGNHVIMNPHPNESTSRVFAITP